MLGWTRRKLALLRYYSASRQHTIWSRLGDMSLWLSLVLALPAAWWCDRLERDGETIYELVGMIERGSEGTLTAFVADPATTTQAYDASTDERFAYFTIDVDRLERGLPLVTSHVTRQPVLIVRRFSDLAVLSDEETKAGTPVREAIETALASSTLADAAPVLELWREGQPRQERLGWAWVAGSILWWMGLFTTFSILLLFARIASIFLLRNRAARTAALRAEGKCPHCAYDLRGLEFSERCPECGALQH